jgi:hypothetical protein
MAGVWSILVLVVAPTAHSHYVLADECVKTKWRGQWSQVIGHFELWSMLV